MSNEVKTKLLEFKIRKIESKGDLDKRAGVLRKLRRELRTLEK